MPREFVLSCGMSLKSALCWTPLRDLGLATHPDLTCEALRRRSSDDPDLRLVERYLDGLWGSDVRAATRLEQARKHFDLEAWNEPRRAHLSAELAELRLVRDDLVMRGETPIGEGDSVHLIHDEGTPEAAQALAAVLAEHGRAMFPSPHAPPVIQLVPIRRLDAANPGQYLEGLGALADWLNGLDARTERIYGITGGFKATVAFCALGARQDHDRSPIKLTDPPRSRVRVCYVHQHSDALLWLEFDGGVDSLVHAALTMPLRPAD